MGLKLGSAGVASLLRASLPSQFSSAPFRQPPRRRRRHATIDRIAQSLTESRDSHGGLAMHSAMCFRMSQEAPKPLANADSPPRQRLFLAPEATPFRQGTAMTSRIAGEVRSSGGAPLISFLLLRSVRRPSRARRLAPTRATVRGARMPSPRRRRRASDRLRRARRRVAVRDSRTDKRPAMKSVTCLSVASLQEQAALRTEDTGVELATLGAEHQGLAGVPTRRPFAHGQRESNSQFGGALVVMFYGTLHVEKDCVGDLQFVILVGAGTPDLA